MSQTTTRSRDLTAKNGTIVDLDDRDFAIVYDLVGDPMSGVDLFSPALYGLATASRAPGIDTCQDLAGFNEKRSVQWIIHGFQPAGLGYLLSYGMIGTGLRLLATGLYNSHDYREVSFRFVYNEDSIGSGNIR